ncbi:MAG: hypothetical protein MRY85_02170, partial [Phaeodactylibacter sp.]|nr:hypothetical protein [Phaeodactylibacter sp.]
MNLPTLLKYILIGTVVYAAFVLAKQKYDEYLFLENYTLLEDKNFEQHLVERGIDTDSTVNGRIANVDARKVKSLLLNDKDIKSLKGIASFKNLAHLYCVSNQLQKLDISSNDALVSLYCHRNKLTELDVSKNLELTHLECSANQIEEIDVSANTSLELLGVGANPIKKLD